MSEKSRPEPPDFSKRSESGSLNLKERIQAILPVLQESLSAESESLAVDFAAAWKLVEEAFLEKERVFQGINGLCRHADALHQMAHTGDRRSKKKQNAIALYESYVSTLGVLGVELMGGEELIGEVFDPAVHRILETIPAAPGETANTITRFLGHGAYFNSNLVRPVEVAISIEAQKQNKEEKDHESHSASQS